VEIEGVQQAQPVVGPYDVIVRAEARSMDALGRLVVSRIQAIHGVTRTLIVRRVRPTPGSQLALFCDYDYHPFITDRDGSTLELEADHRRHAEVENTIRDLKYGVGLNHLPSGRFAANAAWLTLNVLAHNLARWTSRLGLGETLITTKTLRTRYLDLPGRLTRSARRWHLHLPTRWPWAQRFLLALETGCAACRSQPDTSPPPQHPDPDRRAGGNLPGNRHRVISGSLEPSQRPQHASPGALTPPGAPEVRSDHPKPAVDKTDAVDPGLESFPGGRLTCGDRQEGLSSWAFGYRCCPLLTGRCSSSAGQARATPGCARPAPYRRGGPGRWCLRPSPP
jgi:hypothetical protein